MTDGYARRRLWCVAPTLVAALTCASFAPTEERATAEEWLPVPAQSLEIAEDSVLNFAGRLAPAGSSGALQMRGDGSIGFADRPGPAHFHCALLASGPQQTASFPTHDQADRLAVQLRRHGYTLARIHNIDYRLTRHGTGEMAIDPEQLDRLHYLLAALKREGIHWMLDIFSRGSRGFTAAAWNKPGSPDDLRVRLHFDPAARTAWRAFVDRVFAGRNRYTGVTTLGDPALAFIVGANENSIRFSLRPGQPHPAGLVAAFGRWQLTSPDGDHAATLGLPRLDAGEDGASLLDRFLSDLEVGTYRWMEGALRARGFHGPLLAYHDIYPGINGRTRAALPVIDVHAYVGEVTGLEKGAEMRHSSLTEDRGLGELLTNVGARWLDRPMLASEYGAPFPNPRRFETGLLVPALAAFQGWTTLCRMAFQPIENEIPAPAAIAPRLRSYAVGLDPIERAAETLGALLFLRGDVRPAVGTIAVPFGDEQFRQPGSMILPLPIKGAALFSRFGLIPPGKTAALPRNSYVLHLPAGGTPLGQAFKAMTRGSAREQLAQLAGTLRARGILPPGNRSDPLVGRYQSDTGEVFVDQAAGLVSVVTPRTEAASVADAALLVRLGTMQLSNIRGGGLVAASAMDGQPLSRSRRILLILASDARSTDMALDGSPSRRTLVDWGRLPIEVRRMTADITLAGQGGAFLSPLTLNGTPMGRRIVKPSSGGLTVRLDTGAIPNHPTTFFLLERDGGRRNTSTHD